MQELLVQPPCCAENKPPEPKKPSFFEKLAKAIGHAAALAIWVYAILKLFVYDIDNFLIQTYVPAYSWIIEYKVLFIIAIISIVILILNRSYILKLALFIVFYPVLILLWYIPKFVFKTNNSMFLVAFLNSLFSFFETFRYNFICVSAGLIAIALILSVNDKSVLYISAGMLILLLSIMYFNRIVLAFKPYAVIKIYEKIFSEYGRDLVIKQKLDDSLKSLPIIEMDSTQLTAFRSHLEMSLLANRISLFAAKLLREYK